MEMNTSLKARAVSVPVSPAARLAKMLTRNGFAAVPMAPSPDSRIRSLLDTLMTPAPATLVMSPLALMRTDVFAVMLSMLKLPVVPR